VYRAFTRIDAGEVPAMQRASTVLGDEPGRIRNRLRSVTRSVLTIGYQAWSPKTWDAMVQSYRKLMATTRAVLRDADTMVRRLDQRATHGGRRQRLGAGTGPAGICVSCALSCSAWSRRRGRV
jgi:hypothetical protein